MPQVIGSRASLGILLPVPEAVFTILPLSRTYSFRVTPIFFNIGINETATIAESFGSTHSQERSNIDNFDRLNEYYHRFKKLNLAGVTDGLVKTCKFIISAVEINIIAAFRELHLKIMTL